MRRFPATFRFPVRAPPTIPISRIRCCAIGPVFPIFTPTTNARKSVEIRQIECLCDAISITSDNEYLVAPYESSGHSHITWISASSIRLWAVWRNFETARLIFPTICTCFCAASSGRRGIASFAEKRVYPFTSTRIGCKNDAPDELQSDLVCFLGPAKSIVRFLHSLPGSKL